MRTLLLVLAAWTVVAAMGCDQAPPPPPQLVVAWFPETDAPLPPLVVRQTTGLGVPYDEGSLVPDAVVEAVVGSTVLTFEAVPDQPGVYAPPSATAPVGAGTPVQVTVRRRLDVATASSLLPPAIMLDSVRVLPEAAPVEAVFADSVSGTVREGYLYFVTVKLYWTATDAPDSWVRARLQPPTSFPSAVVDYLLLTDQILEEDDAEVLDDSPVRYWRGLYAVPVMAPTDPLPSHRLQIDLVRSGADYARYALSRSSPDRRDPEGNVVGGLGIVAGLSHDQRVLTVGP